MLFDKFEQAFYAALDPTELKNLQTTEIPFSVLSELYAHDQAFHGRLLASFSGYDLKRIVTKDNITEVSNALLKAFYEGFQKEVAYLLLDFTSVAGTCAVDIEDKGLRHKTVMSCMPLVVAVGPLAQQLGYDRR
jgi:hypothetical protein